MQQFTFSQPLFAVSRLKFASMSLATGGLYQVYWSYKNWKAIKENTQESLSPFWRAIFSIFFLYSLFNRIKQESEIRSLNPTFQSGPIFVLWFLFLFASNLPDPFWLIGLLGFIPLLPIRKAIDDLNLSIDPSYTRNDKFSAWNIIELF